MLGVFQTKLGWRARFHADRSDGAEKISRKGAKNAQQYVTNALPSRFGRFA
jgi:hypothetical protein